MKLDLTVDCKYIIPMGDNQTRFLENATIGVKGERIIALEKTEIFYTQFESEKRLDLSNQNSVIIPGLINAHTHTPLSLLRGYSDDEPLKIWLEKFIWPAEIKFLSSEFVEIGTQLSVWEMLKTGTTMFNDMYWMPEQVLHICKQANIRAVLGKPCINIGNTNSNEQVEESVKFVETLHTNPHPLIQSSINPHSLYSFAPEYHKELIDKTKQFDTIYHTHINEVENESDTFYTQTGKTTIGALDDIGALNSRCILAHCVWLNDEEAKILAEKKVNVCHCPRSNMKLGSGVCNVKRLMDLGVNVCIGTDSSCSNNSLNLLLEAQTASLLAKVHCLDASVLDDYTALKMATINGAKALQREHDLGSLEVGKLADFVCVNMNGFECLPIIDPISPLIFTNSYQVQYVWVGGKMVVEEGQVLTVQPDRKKIEIFGENLKIFKNKIIS